MKIAVLEIGASGGIAHYAYNLVEALAKNPELEVILLTHTQYELENLKRKFTLIKIPLKGVSYCGIVWRLINTLRKIKPDVLHVQNFVSVRKDWILFMFTRCMQCKIVLTAHNVYPHDEKEKTAKGMQFALKRIYHAVSAIITHSDANKKELIGTFAIPQEKISVIPHGNYIFHVHASKKIDKTSARKQLKISQDEKVILCFGAIREYKGIQHLIPAFSEVVHTVSGARLVIAGPKKDIGFLKSLEQLLLQYHIQNRVSIFPCYIPLEDISIYFKACDVAVFPYLHTYGSGALHTALSFAKPVIVSDLEVFHDMVQDADNGYRVSAHNASLLAKSMIRCLTKSNDELERMGQRSLYIAKTKFNWNDIAKNTFLLYNKFCKKDILIIASGFSPPYNERWKNAVRLKAHVLDAFVVGTSTRHAFWARSENCLFFSNSAFMRYLALIPYLMFIQHRFKHIVIEGSIESRFNRFIYSLVKKNMLKKSKCTGVSYVAGKWLENPNKNTLIFITDTIGSLQNFLVCDEAEKERLNKINPKLSNILTVRAGIDIERFSEKDSARSQKEKPTFLFASAPQGRWSAQKELHNKGITILLNAFGRLLVEQDASLCMIWRGAYKKELIALINELNIRERVSIVDGVIDIKDYYNAATATVFCAQGLLGSPHYPMSVMESLACGTPVIVTHIVGISNIVERTHCGVVIEPGEDALFEALRYVCTHHESFRAHARKTAQEYFDYKKNIKVFLESLDNE